MRSRAFAKVLRRRMTNAEAILWSHLRRQQLNGRRLRRQHPVGPYVADFACIETKLIIEIDGATHNADLEIKADEKRTAFLEHDGWRVIRLGNRDVYDSLDDVLEHIHSTLNHAAP